MVGLATICLPSYLSRAFGTEVCQRQGTMWIPMDGVLAKLFFIPGATIIGLGFVLTLSAILRVRNDRRLYKLLSHFIPPL